MNDWQLLLRYRKDASEQAFAELVERHLKMVYAVCRRDLDDATLAEDAAQVTFMLLARKANSLRPTGSLAGWLFQTAHFVSRSLRKQEARRIAREARMQAEASNAATASEFHVLEPFLNEALAALLESERTMILLRFFEERSYPEIAGMFDISTNAAEKRTGRALDKLRRHLLRNGAAPGAVVLGALLLDQSAHSTAPLVASDVVLAALNPPGTASTTLIAQGVLKTMYVTQVKIAAMAAVCVLAVGTVTTVGVRGLTAGVRTLSPNSRTLTPAARPLTLSVGALTPSPSVLTPIVRALTPSVPVLTPSARALTRHVRTITPHAQALAAKTALNSPPASTQLGRIPVRSQLTDAVVQPGIDYGEILNFAQLGASVTDKSMLTFTMPPDPGFEHGDQLDRPVVPLQTISYGKPVRIVLTTTENTAVLTDAGGKTLWKRNYERASMTLNVAPDGTSQLTSSKGNVVWSGNIVPSNVPAISLQQSAAENSKRYALEIKQLRNARHGDLETVFVNTRLGTVGLTYFRLENTIALINQVGETLWKGDPPGNSGIRIVDMSKEQTTGTPSPPGLPSRKIAFDFTYDQGSAHIEYDDNRTETQPIGILRGTASYIDGMPAPPGSPEFPASSQSISDIYPPAHTNGSVTAIIRDSSGKFVETEKCTCTGFTTFAALSYNGHLLTAMRPDHKPTYAAESVDVSLLDPSSGKFTDEGNYSNVFKLSPAID